MLEEPSPARQAELLRLSGPALAKRLSFGARDRLVEILPGVVASDPRVLRMKAEVADRLSQELPKSPIDAGLFTDTAVTGEWQRLRNVAGMGMSPGGSPTGAQPPEVPRAFRSARDEELFRYIARELTSHVVPSAFRVRREASTGHPAYGKDMDVKVRALSTGMRVFTDRRLRAAWRSASGRPDLPALAREGLWLTSTKAERAQPDRVRREKGAWVTTPRPVTDWQGRRMEADKTLDLHGRLPNVRRALGSLCDEHFRTRLRVAYAISAPINYSQLTVASGVRAGMYRRFPALFHFRGPESQEQKQSPEHQVAVTLDMKTFDQQQGLMLIDAFIDALPVIDEVKTALTLLVRCPTFVNSDVIGQRGGRWLGDPLDPSSFTAEHGNISGWCWNDILNAVVGTWVSIMALRDIGVWSQVAAWQAEVDMLLLSTHPLARINNKGDDTILWLRDLATRDKLEKLLRTPGRPLYFDIEVEDGAQFLGSVLVREGGRVRFLPNLASYLNNLLVTEYSAGSRDKPYASFGYFQRQAYYGRHPLFRVVDRVLEDASARHLGRRLSDFAESTLVEPPGYVDLQDYATMTFITNPASIYYKVDPEALPPGLFEQFFLAIPADEAWPLFGEPLLDTASPRLTILPQSKEQNYHG